MKVEFSPNSRGFVEAEAKEENGEYRVFLTDSKGRVYKTKTTYKIATIKKYFGAGNYRIFVRNMKTGGTNIEKA
tara:strand:- start:90 stop:311 length:222 start_codon:yes stop_codon:yes gene_type:complete